MPTFFNRLVGMATVVVSRRSRRGFVVLLVSTLLLLISIARGLFGPNIGPLGDTRVKRQVYHEALPIYDLLRNDLGETINLQLRRPDPPANSSSSLVDGIQRHNYVERARPEEEAFQTYRAHGQIAWDQVQATFGGGCDSRVRDFLPGALANGWERKDSKEKYNEAWDEAFEELLGKDKVPTVQQSFYIELGQNISFINIQGNRVEQFENGAHYYQYYLPSASAIIVADINSPANQVVRRFRMRREPAPSTQVINDQYVPPLNRWSDITWLLWNETTKGNPNNLRYIGHDRIGNLKTQLVMEYVFKKHADPPGPDEGSDTDSDSESEEEEEDEPEFPGLVFGMDTDEGKALLGTPNGIGTARLLIDRVKSLGRREPKVYIFSRGDSKGFYCMLWDLGPPPGQPGTPQQPGTPGHGKKRRRGRHRLHHPSRFVR